MGADLENENSREERRKLRGSPFGTVGKYLLSFFSSLAFMSDSGSD